MLQSDIQDVIDFEIALTKIVLKRNWAHPYTAFSLVKGKSSATVSGVIRLTDKHLLSEDRNALQNDVRHQIAHLITGVRHKHSFSWQYIANKLLVESRHIRITAKEVTECKLCGKLTVLVRSQRCPSCKAIEDVVRNNKETVLKILELYNES